VAKLDQAIRTLSSVRTMVPPVLVWINAACMPIIIMSPSTSMTPSILPCQTHAPFD